MGGKKKSLANRLAKMSDEERARYLQRKADVEEEARRRKEQLIAIFFKNKIKKEDGFSRLNLAKINQQWHQILRLDKCREMKEDVEHMKKYMDRVVEYKNRTIQLLMEELKMAEHQYQHNFQAHYTHIDQTIESHQNYMDSLDEQHRKDLEDLLALSTKEHLELKESSLNQHQHLKTVIFGQNSKFLEKRNFDKERFLKKKEDLSSTFRLKLEACIKERENRCGALWRQIAAVIKSHVSHTDQRRSHLAELKRLDAESAAEIATNQERINAQQEEIELLKQQFEVLTAKNSELIKNLQKELKVGTSKFFSTRIQFRKEVQKDDKVLIFLNNQSTQAIHFLQNLKTKGEQILGLMMTCQKFETQKEKVTKFLPMQLPDILIEDEEKEEIAKKSQGTEETVKKVVISVKSPQMSPRTEQSKEEDILKREFALLENMERFWVIYNKVDLDFKGMKQEKRVLLEQNKYFRGMIRAVLEAVVLDQSNPNSKVSTRVASKSKGPQSAPLRRIIV